MTGQTFQVRWSSRLMGLFVLGVSGAGLALLAREGGPTWSWALCGTFAAIATVASVANFGDRVVVDDQGLRSRNAVLAAVGLARERTAAWSEVARAVDQDGSTWFLEVDAQRRWVLDHLDGHEHLGLLLQDHGVPVERRRSPRPWRLGRGDGQGRA